MGGWAYRPEVRDIWIQAVRDTFLSQADVVQRQLGQQTVELKVVCSGSRTGDGGLFAMAVVAAACATL